MWSKGKKNDDFIFNGLKQNHDLHKSSGEMSKSVITERFCRA